MPEAAEPRAAATRRGTDAAGGGPPVRLLAPEPLLFALAAGLAAFSLTWGVGPHDEGLVLQAASRIADGQWPYRDFWWNYGPGQPLLLAAFGTSLLWWRILWAALAALVSVLAYRIVRPVAPAWLALLVWVAVAGAMAWPANPGPNPAVLALVGGALLAVRRSRAAAGALCGVAILFRPDLGCAGALVVALAGGGWRSLAWAAGVGAALLAPFFAVAPGAFADDVVGFLGIADQQRTALPLHGPAAWDPNKVLELWFPLILLAGSALWLAVATARRRLVALPLVLAGVLYLVGRPDEFHLVPLSVVLAVALGLLAAREQRRTVRLALLVVVALIAVNGLERRAGQALHPPALAAIPSPVADGVRTSPDDAAALRALIPRLHALAPPGAPIFVAPPRFDAVRAGDPLLYVLARRPNPTRYDVMQPGVVTTASAQREMIADLERTRPAALVRWLDPRGRPTARSSGVHLLDRYLAAHYGDSRRFGAYVLLRRYG